MGKCKSLCALMHWPGKILDKLCPVADLFVRCWLAEIFFSSGWTKIQSWDTTVMLFTHEYHVPLLSPELAACLGTGAELILPVLLVLGLGTRLPIIALFIFNLVAAYSYPWLWTDAGANALKDHLYWGIMIGYLMFHGWGKLSLDYFLCCWCRKKCGDGSCSTTGDDQPK